VFNLVSDRVEGQSRENAKANPTYRATIPLLFYDG